MEKAELRYRGRNGSFTPKLDRLGTDLSGEDLHNYIDGTRMEKMYKLLHLFFIHSESHSLPIGFINCVLDALFLLLFTQRLHSHLTHVRLPYSMVFPGTHLSH